MQTDLATAELIRDYVLSNLDKRFSPRELAKQFDKPENFITRRIPELLHASLADLAHEKRMERAVILLREGHQQKEVAALLGYDYTSNFCTAFKNHYGCTPNVYAKKI